MKQLQDKVAILTGGSGGIGTAVAKRFLKEGAKVVLVDVSQDDLDNAKKDLDGHGEVMVIKADVSKEDDVKNYVKQTVDKFGKIDVFFNNAGIEGKIAPIADTKLEDFNKVFSVNVIGVFLGLKHVIPVMTKQQSGSIINTSSVAGLDGTPEMAPYVASKHAITGLTKTAALEVADKNVRVNSVHPSPADTRMMRSIESGFSPDNSEQSKEDFTKQIPLGRYAKPEDVANLVLFLASDDSKFITGAQYRVDGGMGAGQ